MQHNFTWYHDGKESIVEIRFPEIKNHRFLHHIFLATGKDNRPFKAIENDLEVGMDLILDGKKADGRNSRLDLSLKLQDQLPKLTGYRLHPWSY